MVTYLLFLLVLLQIADVCTTFHVIDREIGREVNPVMAWMLDFFGVLPGLLIPKVALLCLAGLYLLVYPLIMALLCAIYAVVVYKNVKVIRAAN